MTHHFSSLSRRLLVAVLVSLLTAAVGIAQPKAEKSIEPTVPSQASIAPSAGVLVSAVEVGSPAEKAGIVRGDIILSINGTAVDTPQALQQALNGKAAGDTVTVKLRHGDAEKTVSVTLGTLNGRAWVGLFITPSGLGTGMGLGRGVPNGRGFAVPARAPGAYVTNVVAGSPAEKAGVKAQDVIQSVDGTAIDAAHGLSDLIAARKVGDTVTLSILPGGVAPAKDVKVVLVKSPDKDAPYLGIQYTMGAPRGFGQGRMGQAAVAGAFVAQVATDSPAGKAGLQAGDIITKVAGVAVTGPQQVVDAVGQKKPGDTLVLTVRNRDSGKEADLTVTLGQNPSDATKAYLGVSMSATDLGPGGQGFRGGQPRTQITPGPAMDQPPGSADAVPAPSAL